MKLTMKVENKQDNSKNYSFSVSDSTGKNEHPIFTKSVESTETMQLPDNSWSPDNRYVFIVDSINNTADAFVFQLSETKGEPLLIVIEDLHQVYDAEWLVAFFRRLLPLLPSDVHALITCRSLPPTRHAQRIWRPQPWQAAAVREPFPLHIV